MAFFIIGPCALESFQQVRPLVDLCKRFNITYFRAQLFKPRTHPESFQGLGEKGLNIIKYLKSEGLRLVSEAGSVEQMKVVCTYADVLQIGARNMQNFELLKQVGSYLGNVPYVLLKRGQANTEYEWLASARYLETYGVPSNRILLCERGTRNAASPSSITLDLAMAYLVKNKTAYKVIADPSHGTRDSALVLPMAKAALAIGLDGVMIEVHPFPNESWSDSAQAISIEEMEKFLKEIKDGWTYTLENPSLEPGLTRHRNDQELSSFSFSPDLSPEFPKITEHPLVSTGGNIHFGRADCEDGLQNDKL